MIHNPYSYTTYSTSSNTNTVMVGIGQGVGLLASVGQRWPSVGGQKSNTFSQSVSGFLRLAAILVKASEKGPRRSGLHLASGLSCILQLYY